MKLQVLAALLAPVLTVAYQQPTFHHLPITNSLGEFNISYVEAGHPSLPTLVLLHGFPSSINQFRHFIPLLSDSYHIIAPDLPGFGHTTVPPNFTYTFANLASAIETFLDDLSLPPYALYVFDYGAPVGWRLALSQSNSSSSSPSQPSPSGNKNKIRAIITQNGNAYLQGLGHQFWAPIRRIWRAVAASPQNQTEISLARQAVASAVLTPQGTKEQYTMGQQPQDLDLLDPNTWTLDYETNIRGGINREKQLDLFTDYADNVEVIYPEIQRWFKENRDEVPILAVWGKGDPAFVPAGARAFEEDLGRGQVRRTVLVEGASHFALETRLEEVVGEVRGFLGGVEF